MSVVDSSYDQPMKLEEKASAPLAGGIMNQGYQCGMLWGAALAAGAESYRRFGPGAQAEKAAIVSAQRCIESFKCHTNDEINCGEISDVTKIDIEDSGAMFKYMLTGGPIRCFRLSARYAPDAFGSIEDGLAENEQDVPTAPVSCAALLARKMGVSDMQATMAAGFAGGIGLSGEACGALAAAIWITAMKPQEDGVSKMEYFNNPEYSEVIERFLESSDYEFECSAIVGRKFEDVTDHAAYLREGGCAKIIDALAVQPTPN
jgi:hypothetical protein